MTPLLSTALFRRLIVFASACFLAIWLIDSTSGIISPFDAVSYPTCTLGFAIIYFLSITKVVKDQYLHLATYFIVAGYLIGSSIWHHSASNGLFSNAAQWLGLNYVIAYLFLELRKAVFITVLAFVVTIVGHFVVLIQHYSMKDTLGVVLNIGVAHIVYIVLLWAVIKLRTSKEEAQKKVSLLENYAYIDPLTHLLNRRGLEKVSKELEIELSLEDRDYAILLLDIDHFKYVNDQYGHLRGDEVLKKVASLLTRIARPQDILGRWGGEEFVVFIPNGSGELILEHANLIRQSINDLNLGELSVTISIGVGYSHSGNDITDTFRLADRHLYAAKEAGRNRVVDRIVTNKELEGNESDRTLR